jgi:hypothetical protein
MDLINALPGNNFVNTDTGNNRSENVFSMRSAPSESTDIGSLLPGNATVNMHLQQWETVFSVGSEQRSYKQTELRFTSEFSVEDSHGKFAV